VRERGLVPEEGAPSPLGKVPPLPVVALPAASQQQQQQQQQQQAPPPRLLDLATLGTGARPLVVVAASGS